ncbi:hypothetical protein [Nocardioides cynanchi]|uniref:hypothetical protein n=1 Tax=Nocardioides cynanchi TaxID=2558918 RepID=UPI001245F4A9|nr:hypothetical protein [Nocardioides cynanchi]
MSLVHRACVALLSTALAASLVSAGGSAQAVSSSSPAGHGATWLADQLDAQGLIHNPNFGGFDDYGLTIDTTLALVATGGHRTDVAKARTALSKHVDDYTTGAAFGTSDVFAGAIAKLLVLAQQTGGGARHFGGANLVHRLDQRVITAAPARGRIQDVVDPTNTFGADSANTIGQVFAARGLLDAGSDLAPSVLRFLLEQQCSRGFFRLAFTSDKTAPNQGCRAGDDSDADVTALAVIELAPVAQGHRKLRQALADATRWLKRQQGANGALHGGASTDPVNSNTTGLAGWAFRTEGACSRARRAATWVLDLQVSGDVSGTPLAGERGAVAYDRAAFAAARQDGITKATRDQWRRATAQAAPALLALNGCRAA